MPRLFDTAIVVCLTTHFFFTHQRPVAHFVDLGSGTSKIGFHLCTMGFAEHCTVGSHVWTENTVKPCVPKNHPSVEVIAGVSRLGRVVAIADRATGEEI